jgi:ribosome-binding factor A
MQVPRVKRLNSLLKRIISEVISKDVRNPNVSKFLSVTNVEITSDLHFAKVLISVLGSKEEKEKTIEALNSASVFIRISASKKIVIRHFPELSFKLDSSVDEHLHIDKILKDLEKKEKRQIKNDDQ